MINDAAAVERFDPSLDGLLNCVVRELPGWRLVRAGSGRPEAFQLELPDRGLLLRARLRHHSPAGYHAFEPPLLLGPTDRLRPAVAVACIALLIEDPALVGPTTPAGRERFLARLTQSRRNVDAALAARAEQLDGLFSGGLDFAASEQAQLTGHPVHPAPKSYDELGCDDVAAFAPEFAAAFPLHWFLVDRRALDIGGTPDHLPADAVQSFFRSDPALPVALKLRVRDLASAWLPLPMHPWQGDRLRGPLARLIAEGLAEDLGRIGSPFRPTSSMRTLQAGHAPYMPKFSLSVRVTNSRRLMEPKEWQRGKQMHQLLTGPFADVLADETPSLQVLGEPVHLALRDERGWLAESAVVLRVNPFRGLAARDVAALVSLCQAHPHGGGSRLAWHLDRLTQQDGLATGDAALLWLDRFLEVAVAPLLRLEAAHGLLLSAHGQNLLLRLEADLPVASYYRDCQGAGYDLARAEHLRRWLPDLGEGASNGVERALGHKLLAYYLVVNAVFHLVASLARAAGTDERALLGRLRRFLMTWRVTLPGRSPFADHLLETPCLPFKANFLTCLRDINESHAGDEQLAVYGFMPNPIATADLTDPRTR